MEFSPIDFRNYTLTCEDKDNIPIIWNGEAPKARKHRNNVATALTVYWGHFLDKEFSIDYLAGNRTFSGRIVSDLTIHEALKVIHVFGAVEKSEFPFSPKTDEEAEDLVSDFWFDLNRKGHKLYQYVYISDFDDIKKYIELTNMPVVVGVDWYEDTEVRNGTIRSRKKGEYDGKALLIYGWTEKGWKVLNPNDPDWGNEGCAILPYYCPIHECWCAVPPNAEDFGLKIRKPFKRKGFRWIAKILNAIGNGLGF